MSAHENFEIQVLRDGRWVTDSVRDSEMQARQLVNTLLGDRKCAGARIVGNSSFRDGSSKEEVVFEKTQDVDDEKPIQIVPIESAPVVCKTPRDFFSLESRMILNRILRSYLEFVFLTPTELLHGVNDLKRLDDRGSLVPTAVNHIAKLQTQDTDQPTKDRQEEIYAITEQITLRARRADTLPLPKFNGKFSETLAAVSGIGEDTPEYLAMVVLSRELCGIRSWVGKLDRLCKMATDETDPKAVLLLDTVIADVLGANVIQELLGWKRSLGSAIISMLDLADGTFDAEESDAREAVDLMLPMLETGVLPASRHVIIDRAIAQLKSSAPLYRADPAKEMEEYQRVLARLLMPGGIISGAKAAEALTMRGTRFVEQGGATGRRAAITATLKCLPDRARGVMYLAELSNTGFADGHQEDIVKQLDVVFSARVIGELCRRSLSPKDRMVAATGAYTATVSSALPDPVKQRVADHIDNVLERYLVDEDIINKLDKPEDHIRDRAVRLVKFCGAGVLPEGKALNLARKRVVQLLRQPKFDVHFVQGIDGATKAEKALRDFHKLLVKARLA